MPYRKKKGGVILGIGVRIVQIDQLQIMMKHI